MYNKHTFTKTMFQAIVDNRTGVEFNTAKKRDAFVKLVAKSNTHTVTAVSNVSYPWNPEAGLHGLKSPEEFAKLLSTTVEKVHRAIKNGYLQTEQLGDKPYIVNNHDTYVIKGIHYDIAEN